MKHFGVGLVVIAVAIAAEASQQHAQYVAAPRDFQTQEKHTSSVKVIHHHHIVPSVVSATALAHQQHAQRVAQEQQDRISKAAFGRGPANPGATVIQTSMSHPAEGTSPSPVAFTLIRQRPLHGHNPNLHQAPVAKQQQPLKTSSSSAALQYHPVMRYTTVIKHPSPGGATAASQASQASEYTTIPSGVYQKQFYGSGKYEVAGSVPYVKSLAGKTFSPIAYDANGVGPLSRPLYSPAAVKKPSQPEPLYYQPSAISGPSGSPSEESPPGSSLYSVSAHTVPEESPFNPSDVEAIEPSVQLPPEALKEILGDNYQDYYSSPSGQPQRPDPSTNQELFPQTMSLQEEAPRKSIFGTPMKYVPHRRPQHQHQHHQQQAVLTTSNRHLTSHHHQSPSGPSEVPESEVSSPYSLPQSAGVPSYFSQPQQQLTASHSIAQAPLVHSHASSLIQQSPQRYVQQQQQQALVPHPAYAQFGAPPQQVQVQAPVAPPSYPAYMTYAAQPPQQHQIRAQVAPSYVQHHQPQPQPHPQQQLQQPYFTQMTGHHAPPQYIAYQQISSIPSRAAAAVQAEVGSNGVDSIKPDIDSVYSLPF